MTNRRLSLNVWIMGMAVLGVLAACPRAGAQENLWATGHQWLSVRAGFANSAVRNSGNGGGGFGFGYSRFFDAPKIWKWELLKNCSLGGYVHYEVLGRTGDASEIEVPITLELTKHLGGPKSFYHPYFGLGGGGFYRKTVNTGDDLRVVEPGYYLTFGSDSPIAAHQALGLDVRMVRVNAVNDPVNPVFGAGSVSRSVTSAGNTLQEGAGTHWSFKLNWALVY